jgi:putative intracellular protease/amidase
MRPITILLTNGYSDWETGLISGAGGLFFGAEIRFVSPDGAAVTSAGGLVTGKLDKLEPVTEDVLVICGGTIWDGANAPDITHVLNTTRAAGATIAAICGGTLAVARAGLLDAIPHTSNGAAFLPALAPQYAGAAHYVDQPKAISSDGIITAAGTSPVSFAAAVLSAAGLPPEAVAQFHAMLGAEHHA